VTVARAWYRAEARRLASSWPSRCRPVTRRRAPRPRGRGARRAAYAGSVAGELLTQRLQRFVRSEGAVLGLLRRRGAGVRGRRVGLRLGLGLLRALDLRLVRFPARVGLGVLPLPLLALLLVARQPVVGLRVEALGVLVVALFVVVGGHAVQRRVEVLADVRGGVALVGLLQRQRDPATLEVDVDDLDHDVLADRDDLLGNLDVALGQLRDVHQALDAVLDADEGTERHQLGDLARHDLPDLVHAGELLPRVLESGLERQRHPL